MNIAPVMRTRVNSVILKAGRHYAYEKSLHILLQTIEAGNFQPTLDRDTANYNFHHILTEYSNRFEVRLPKTFEDWSGLMEHCFEKCNLSRYILEEPNPLTEQPFSDSVRIAHKGVLERSLAQIEIVENWFFYNQNILREIVSNF